VKLLKILNAVLVSLICLTSGMAAAGIVKFSGQTKFLETSYFIRITYDSTTRSWKELSFYNDQEALLAKCPLKKINNDEFVLSVEKIEEFAETTSACDLKFMDPKASVGEVSVRLASYGIFDSEVGLYSAMHFSVVRSFDGHNYCYAVGKGNIFEQ
jgi:hypothetical protein